MSLRKLLIDLNKLQETFAFTAFAASVGLPYLFSYSLRKIKSVPLIKMGDVEKIGIYSGFSAGLILNTAQVMVYYEYGIEQGNYWMFGLPVITNLLSKQYEVKRKNLESKLK